MRRLLLFVLILIPNALLLCENCIQIEDVFFDAKNESFFVSVDEKLVKTSLWDPFVFNIKKLKFCKKESARRFDDARIWEGATVFLCDSCTSNLCHPFHFLEHLLGIWCFGGCEERENIQHIVFCAKDSSSFDFDWEGEKKISKKILHALFPNARVCTLKSLKEKKHSKIFIQKLLFSSRYISFIDPDCCKIKKMLGGCWECIPADKLELFRSLILSSCNVFVESCYGCPRITFLPRHPPCYLNKKIEKHLIHTLSDLTGCSICVPDLEKMRFEEMLKVFANTDILISTHGKGLCHILFLPRYAMVVELFPPDCFVWDYYLFAQMRKLDYWGNSKDLWITPTKHPEWGPFGDIDREVDPIDIDTLLFAIREKIQRLGCN